VIPWGLIAQVGLPALVLAAAFVGGCSHGSAKVTRAWQAEKIAAQEHQAEVERMRRQANQGVTDDHRTRLAHFQAAASAAEHAARLGRAESDSLRDELHARDRANATASGIADEAAAVAVEFLGECRERRTTLAREAGELAAQVAGLQDYVNRVCLGDPAP
jgi:hypothetical protein